MTNYSPIFDSLDGDTGSTTVAQMREAGYTDYGQPHNSPSLQTVQAHIAAALVALDGETFDDSAKWQAANQLVAAMDNVNQIANELSDDGVTTTITIEEDKIKTNTS
jgi:hypothetical protein